MSESIAVFAKAALPGRVKTRLTPVLSPEQAAAFHQACVEDIWRTALALVGEGARLYTDEPFEPWMDLAGPDCVRYQKGPDLGVRMLNCFEDLAQEGFRRMMIIGADSPQVPPAHYREGLDLLVSEKDAVLGMSSDGGFYAVGCRKPRRMMFRDVHWSTELAYSETRAAFELAGLSLKSGMYTHYDVDTPEDLERLRREPSLGPRLHAWFRANPRTS
ncbi:MAG: TIGR04282 family arsenosugar biosynthesis glycosyltransferase [Acidobacteria bacterium]|nr:TIGR04282 family arsenosugar biosynthesis glycosyltransferase [Acidobacteriota bacterium]